MSDPKNHDWLADSRRHDITCICERALQAASGIAWQRLGRIAAGGIDTLGEDFYDPTRTIIAEYLRHTGRLDEAAEVEAVGCNEKPPHTGFGSLSAAQLAEMRASLSGL